MAIWVSFNSSAQAAFFHSYCNFSIQGDAAVEGVVGGRGVEQPSVTIPGLALMEKEMVLLRPGYHENFSKCCTRIYGCFPRHGS